MAIRDVIVTGAGAPAADNLPIQSKLFSRFWAKHQSKLPRVRKHYSSLSTQYKQPRDPWWEILWGLDRYLLQFFGIDPARPSNESCFPTFEEALGMLDLASSNGDEFPEVSDADIRAARYNLIVLIATSLLDSMPRVNRRHVLLAQNLAKADRLQQTAFVTTNYDLLLDQALEGTLGGRNLDFVVDFRFEKHRGARLASKRRTRVFKIHGSLDWLYCASCRALDRDDIERVIPGRSRGTPFCACGSVKQPLLVPPSFVKSLSNPYLQRLWTTAEETIAEAKRIIFCGYSFPDADLNFKYLLKRAQLRHLPRRVGHRLREVVVINSHPNKPAHVKQDEAERFRRFFGANIEVRYTDFGFEDFSRDPTIIDR